MENLYVYGMVSKNATIKISVIGIISFIILLLGSLRSYYFIHLGGMRLFVLSSFLLLLLLLPIYKLDKKFLILIMGLISICLVNIALSFIISEDFNPHYFSYVGIIIAPIYGLMFFSFFKNKRELLYKCLRVILIFHLFGFLSQMAAFYIFGFRIDYLNFLTGEEQRVIGGVFSEDTNIRGTGFFNEPASYGLYTVSMIFVLLIYKTKIDFLIAIASLSVLLSFSASGVIFLTIILAIIFYKIIFTRKNIIRFLLLIVVAALAYEFWIKTFFDTNVLNFFFDKIVNFKNSYSYQTRIGSFLNDFSDLSTKFKIFGTGMGNRILEENLGSFYSKITIQMGIVFTTLIYLFFLLKFFVFKVSIRSIMIMALLGLSTYNINHIVMWYFLAIVLIFESSIKHEDSSFDSRIR